jgi:cysteine synthase
MTKYEKMMTKKQQIMKDSLNLDYEKFELDGIAFDYEKMMNDAGYDFESVKKIQEDNHVGETPLVELKQITKYARKFAKKGYGARIFLKDEALNLSGSFKARRAVISVYHAKKMGYKGVVAATSGNYGAAVAAMAARLNLKCIIVQEVFDSKDISQPEIIEKARRCEAYGAEVIQLSVGPELFYEFLNILDETKYFNASLYSPYGIKGIETLGYEIADECFKKEKKYPDAVVITNAGGGNLTGTARGLRYHGAINTQIIAASVDLSGLHMASDHDFNLKSFTTGHTGFGIPFSTFPDRSDVPRSAARPLRYMDRYVLMTQGSVFFMTEALSLLEGMERGPAGNISLAAAFSLAQSMKEDEIIVVQESEYTGAGKHFNSQISFAKKQGIKLMFGSCDQEIPGQNLVFPNSGSDILHKELNILDLKKSYLKHFKNQDLSNKDYVYLKEELNLNIESIIKMMEEINES